MRLRVTLLILLLVLCTSCAKQTGVRFANVPQDWFNAPVLLALAGWSGHPATNGVRTFSLASGLASKTAVISGNAEMGLASPIVLLRDVTAAEKVGILGCYMQSASVLGIATMGDTIAEPIGYVSGTVSEVYLTQYMIKTGRGPDFFGGKLQTISLLPPNLVEAMEGSIVGSASVNSVVVWEPYLSRAASASKAKILRDPSVYTMHVCLIVNKQAYRAAPAAINRFAEDVKEASDYLTAQPDAARERVEQSIGFDAGTLNESWARVDFHYVSDASAIEAILREEIDALQKSRMLSETPDVAAFIVG